MTSSEFHRVLLLVVVVVHVVTSSIQHDVLVVGRDSLRCLALATVDEPRNKDDMNLTDPMQFIHFEVC